MSLSKEYFENGIIIHLKSEEETAKSFIFSITKWRSALGAISNANNQVYYKNEKWDYESGNWAIS